jgi:hypothetical protein
MMSDYKPFFAQEVNGLVLIQKTTKATFHEDIAHLFAMDLEMIIIGNVTATIVVEGSVAATKEILHEALDFAFLDVDVTNGQTFEIAQILERQRVPSSAQNAELKSLLQTGLKLFKEHEKHAEKLVSELQ